ncbi:hypothetical protein D3C75_709380 [compost metagenome]
MKQVKIFSIESDHLSPPVAGEGFCIDMVRHSDYAALEAKCAALDEVRAQARNELIDELESAFKRISETSLTPELRISAGAAATFVSIFRQGASQ